MFLFLFLLFHDLDLELDWPLFLFLLENFIVLVIFMLVTKSYHGALSCWFFFKKKGFKGCRIDCLV
jgi:hypothetical protein